MPPQRIEESKEYKSQCDQLRHLFEKAQALNNLLPHPRNTTIGPDLDLSDISNEIIEEVHHRIQDVISQIHQFLSHCMNEVSESYSVLALFYDMQSFRRVLEYRIAGKLYWPLPTELHTGIFSSRCRTKACLLVAERIAYVQDALREGRDPYAGGGCFINGARPSLNQLRERVDHRYHWLLENGMLFSIEWQVFTYLIACLVDARRHIDMIIDYYLRKLKSRKLPLEQVTTPASSQTVEENGSECPICLHEFTPKDCPIQTKCEHVLGKQCLRKWAKRKDSCPFCRAKLFPAIELLPLPVRLHVDKMISALKCSRTLDVEVDQYLLARLETPTNHIFGELLANLTDSYNK
jgi:hypothetical protein